MTYHQDVVGKPILPPLWSLGWSQSRWGYINQDQLSDVVNNYTDKGIPLDNIFSDIDFMDNYRDFTYDKVNFKKLPDLVGQWKSKNIQWIPIQDAGIAQRPGGNYAAYTQGEEKGVFIKAARGGIFTGRVWPTDTAFVDWFHPEAENWWHDQLTSLHEQVPFSGFWLDMNEVANFCTGTCYDK